MIVRHRELGAEAETPKTPTFWEQAAEALKKAPELIEKLRERKARRLERRAPAPAAPTPLPMPMAPFQADAGPSTTTIVLIAAGGLAVLGIAAWLLTRRSTTPH